MMKAACVFRVRLALLVTAAVQLRCVLGVAPTPPPFGEHTFDPLDFPIQVTEKLMCQACYAAVKELNKRVPMLHKYKKRLTRELVLFEAMNAFCSEGNFFEYTGFPPSYTKACQAFLDKYNDDSVVENRILKGGTVSDQCNRACAEPCEGVDEADRHTAYVISGAQPEAPVQGHSKPEKVIDAFGNSRNAPGSDSDDDDDFDRVIPTTATW